MTGYTGGIGGLPPQPPLDCDGPPPEPSEVIPVVSGFVAPGSDGRFAVFGDHFITNDFGVIDSVEVVTDGGTFTFYATNGPNAGANPPGTSEFTLPDVPDTNSGFSVTAEVLYGLTVSQITVRDEGGNYAVAFDVNPPVLIPGTPPTYPLIESICSPAPDTIRFEGQRFLTATAGEVGYIIVRLSSYTDDLGGPYMVHEVADGSPDAYDWTLVTHTDNVIELQNPRFVSEIPDNGGQPFVVNGAAFHDPTATTMYYYEPAENIAFAVPVDGAGC